MTATGKATKNHEEEETAFLLMTPTHTHTHHTHTYTPLPKNTEKSQECPGNTLTKSQEHQKQHWGPQHGWDNSETGVPSRCDGQGS